MSCLWGGSDVAMTLHQESKRLNHLRPGVLNHQISPCIQESYDYNPIRSNQSINQSTTSIVQTRLERSTSTYNEQTTITTKPLSLHLSLWLPELLLDPLPVFSEHQLELTHAPSPVKSELNTPHPVRPRKEQLMLLRPVAADLLAALPVVLWSSQ